MSSSLVSRSPDLFRLHSEGFNLEVNASGLLVHDVPFVRADGSLGTGSLFTPLTTDGSRAVRPDRHQMWFIGGIPYTRDGVLLRAVHQVAVTRHGSITSDCSFSVKPPSGAYSDYYEMVTNHVELVTAHARAIDPSVSAQSLKPRLSIDESSVFCYYDAATSRAGLDDLAARLADERVAIVGLGGTGSYILDLVAKTRVKEIHLYDQDVLFAHNAFRMPGVVHIDDLDRGPTKVEYLQQSYGEFRHFITPHAVRVDESNVHELVEMSFVFVALDSGPEKRLIVEHLVQHNISFIDTGVGLIRKNDQLMGSVRVTSSDGSHSDHLTRHISFADEAANEYEWNIQTADMNMLNAVLAVIKWKKMRGFYVDGRGELQSTYVSRTNRIHNSEEVDE